MARPVYDTGMDWLGLVTWRFLVGAALSWVWVVLSSARRTAVRSLTRGQVGVAIALGALFTGNSGTYYAALETVPAALAGVLVYTYPVIVAGLSIRFGTRLSGRRQWMALALATVGVVLGVGGVDLSAAPAVGGILLLLVSSMFSAIWVIASARLSGERRGHLGPEVTTAGTSVGDAAAATAIMITSSALVFVGISIGAGHSVDPRNVPAAALPPIAAIGFLTSFLAIQAFYAGAHRIGAANAALLGTVEPLTIVVLAWIILGQSLKSIQLVGSALIVLSVIVAQSGPRPRGLPMPAVPVDAETLPEGRSRAAKR